MVNGELIPPSKIQDEAFAQEVLGQTVAIEPADGVIASPANGTIGVLHETGHAFSVTMADGTELLVHIGIDTIQMKGKGFRVLKKEGDTVKAGEPVVEMDLEAVKKAGYSTQTMLIVTETPGDKRISACSQKAWNERIVIFANLSKNQLEICLKLTFQSLIV